MFNAETLCHEGFEKMVIQKKALISYLSLVPSIEAHGKRMALSNKGFGIGRDKSNAVIVSDPKVSKFHAFITFKKGKAYIKDSGSTNGTWVNNIQVSDERSQELKNKDKISVGSTQILFRC